MRYLDTSAFLRLLVAEDRSAALRKAVAVGSELWSSSLLDVEAHRAAARLGIDRDVVAAALEAVTLVTPAESTFAAARHVGPPELRALDALHLAAALELRPDLEELLTYDRRLATGCDAVGVPVAAPGLPAGWWRS